MKNKINKSVLIIDTPDKCLDCPLGNSEEYGDEEVYCTVLECTTYQSGLYEDEEMYNSKKAGLLPAERNSTKNGKGNFFIG